MISEICQEIIKELRICVFVETGTDMAETVIEVAKWFATFDPKFGEISGHVITGARNYSLGSKPIRYPVFEKVGDSQYKIFSVDSDAYSYENAKKLFRTNPNIQFFHDNSPDFLRNWIDDHRFQNTAVLFFLDAHWGKYWPLRDEIQQVLRLKKFIIVIDDFFVPGCSNKSRPHGDFGFDFYHGKILDWAYIQDLFYNVDIHIYYPCQATIDHRGFVVIFRGYENHELDFLKHFPLKHVDKHDPIHRYPTPLHLMAYLEFRTLIRTLIPLPLLRYCIRTVQKLLSK